ncbi:MAG: 50S ribosomal protein L4 [Clostridia bacterium]|nr:50S ribosomal protein L4 [Clostridia bacterium]
MPKVTLYRTDGTPSGEVELSEAVFAAPVNPALMHEVVVAHLANRRQGTQSALTRAEVRGGGIKPFRQKGTGRARQGSSRSPQYEGGGVVFAPKPRDYSKKVNKKARQAALRSALSSKAADEDIIVVENLTMSEPKTKKMIEVLGAIKAPKALIILGEKDPNVSRSASNIPGVSVDVSIGAEADGSRQYMLPSVYDILRHDKLVLTQDALEVIERELGSAEEGAAE